MRAEWLLLLAVVVVFPVTAARRLRRMGYGPPAVTALACGFAVLAACGVVWGLLTDHLVRALGLVLVAGASGGLVCAVVAVASAVRADLRAVARQR
jgi:hypothetical protein